MAGARATAIATAGADSLADFVIVLILAKENLAGAPGVTGYPLAVRLAANFAVCLHRRRVPDGQGADLGVLFKDRCGAAAGCRTLRLAELLGCLRRSAARASGMGRMPEFGPPSGTARAARTVPHSF